MGVFIHHFVFLIHDSAIHASLMALAAHSVHALCPPICLLRSMAVAPSSRFSPRSMEFLPNLLLILNNVSCILRSLACASSSALCCASNASQSVNRSNCMGVELVVLALSSLMTWLVVSVRRRINRLGLTIRSQRDATAFIICLVDEVNLSKLAVP